MGKKEKTNKKGDAEDEKGDQKLQAIVLADSFTKSFRPITWRYPKVLLPLVNVPMLRYTIEFLAQNGVEEIFVFCVWHADMVQAYISNSKWPSNISVKCISSTACLSAGDALRELDSMGVIRSDPFILISGDVISNMDLQKAIKFHKEKRKSDANGIMTVVLKRVQRTAGVKPVMDDLIVALDRNTSQLLFYEDSVQNDSMSIPREIMEEHPCLICRSDLLDCHVDICSPELLLQFSDNFDYQNIRRHFIRNEAVNWELGKHLYGYILQNEYAARVHDLRTYHYICRDIVSRWVYPVVPESQLLGTNSFSDTDSRSGNLSYREDGVRAARSAVLGEGVVIGLGAVVGNGASLTRTVVGRGCVVGDGAVIVDSHLWAGAVVEEGARVIFSVVCDRAVVKKGAVVNRGCVLSYGVVLGAGMSLPEYTRLTLTKHFDEDAAKTDDVEGDADEFDLDVVGTDGRGCVWQYEGGGDYDDLGEDEEDEEAEAAGKIQGVDVMRAASAGCREEEGWKRRLWSCMPPPEDEDDEQDDFADMLGGAEVDGRGMGGGGGTSALQAKDEMFHRVVRDMVMTGYKDGNLPSNLLMEIKGFKFAHNKEFVDCIHAVTPAVVDLCTTAAEGATLSQVAVLTRLKGMLDSNKWGYTLLEALCQNTTDELAVVVALETVTLKSAQRPLLYPVFRMMLQIVYDSGLVSEEALLKWVEAREKGRTEGLPSELSTEALAMFKQPAVQEFVVWIREDDDEDDDDDDDEVDDD